MQTSPRCYNQTNSGLESLTFAGPNYIDIRINGAAFDKNGDLWVTNKKNGLKVLKTNGQWQRFSTENILDASEDNSFGECSLIETVQNGWQQIEMVLLVLMKVIIPSKNYDSTDTGNLPASDVRALAIDNRNQLWIGTIKGLQYCLTWEFQTGDQLTANPNYSGR
jgi:ligand-binding sensor domain-containing protein